MPYGDGAGAFTFDSKFSLGYGLSESVLIWTTGVITFDPAPGWVCTKAGEAFLGVTVAVTRGEFNPASWFNDDKEWQAHTGVTCVAGADAANGEEALEINRHFRADLIITDIIMPEKEGIETIRDFIQEFPGIKIIAMSGGGRIGPEAYLKIAEGIGAMHTFTKPIKQKELLEAIETLLN